MIAILLICGLVLFLVVSWIRKPKQGREVVFVARGNRPGDLQALEGARIALSQGQISEFFVYLVQLCVEYAVKNHFIKNVLPGQTVRIIEREISRKADTSFYTLFHDIRVAAESVRFAHKQLTYNTCASLLERMEAVYKDGVS